jgi:hypothetical protein
VCNEEMLCAGGRRRNVNDAGVARSVIMAGEMAETKARFAQKTSKAEEVFVNGAFLRSDTSWEMLGGEERKD